MKRTLFALLLSGSLLLAPFAAFAQSADPPDTTAASTDSSPVTVTQDTSQIVPAASDTITPSSTSDSTASASTTSESTASSNTSMDLVQGTASTTQSGVTVSDLESTANPITDVPEDASSTIVVDAATSTDIVTVPLVDAPVADPIPADIPIEPVQDLNVVVENMPEATSTESEAVQLSNAELNAMVEPQYVFAVTGKTIPTKKKGIIGVSTITNSVTATIDTATSSDSSAQVVHVSGSCANTYYVVLLFKNQTDYDTDPGSYLVNRAYPCEHGSYSYNIDDLPTSIKDGTYYLLIGEQGSTGSWSPITGLTEISINRSN